MLQQHQLQKQQQQPRSKKKLQKLNSNNLISIIVVGFKEPRTIGDCIKAIADRKYSGIPSNFELIQVSPDEETLEAGKKAAKVLRLGEKFKQIVDPRHGKPYALKLAFKKAKGSILLLTDGDTKFSKNAVKELLNPLLTNEKVGGSTGRPFSLNKRDSFWGYIGNLLPDSGHHRRIATSKKTKGYYISDKTFFPMSGYILAIRNVIKEIPSDVLADDAYMSYAIRNLGYEIAYVPTAKVAVKFPTNLDDYLKQKVRSLGGYIQLEKYGIFKKDKQSRSFWIELPYALFVLKYPKNFREFIWSLMLFPLRLYTWFQIFIERVILKKGMPKTGWARIESTK